VQGSIFWNFKLHILTEDQEVRKEFVASMSRAEESRMKREESSKQIGLAAPLWCSVL
jgi:hypothetical protein